MFIVIDGPDGSGKDTLIDHLMENRHLYELVFGKKLVFDREPSAEIRQTIINEACTAEEAMFYLFVDRNKKLNSNKKDLVDKNTIVIYNRFMSSTFAYQVHASGIPESTLLKMINLCDNFVYPDLTIILTAPVNVLMERVSDHDKFENSEFLSKVAEGYMKFRGSGFHKALRYIDTEMNSKEQVISKFVFAVFEEMINPWDGEQSTTSW